MTTTSTLRRTSSAANVRQSVELAVYPSHLESDGLPLDVPEFPETLSERLPGEWAHDASFQIPNAVELPRLLRVGREWRREEADGDGRSRAQRV